MGLARADSSAMNKIKGMMGSMGFDPMALLGGAMNMGSLTDLLKQGMDYSVDAYWIGASIISCMTFILVIVTFIGEAVREAYDPKKHTYYE